MPEISNPQIDLAFKYIRYTNKNIFLTGKAGTGKTTFLHNIKKEAFKRMAIVAPTGVAAINAGGMTIHSFFQLPFGPMVPGQVREEVRKKRFNSRKIKLIKSLDLLVIDEISMVRADLLDAIDEVLRRYRDYTKPFGGVQLLMVGDLHQLPPVIKQEEWSLLNDHYDTLYFFGSLALQKTNPVTIELKHIYRQEDHQFIDLLNKVRNNKLDNEVLQLLNSRYLPDFKPDDAEGYIILTSHNAAAQKINKEKLKVLPGKTHRYEAKIDGSFPGNAYPTDELLEFKVGTQVMFVKNDISPEKLYYNGKIGQIKAIDKDGILVKCKDDGIDIIVNPVDWSNIKYSLDEKTKEVKEEVTGTFTQLPLKAAWAITIHKSQGLTFERAIIDAKSAFAHGQVYVALSRCKSFEGIVLRTQIGSSSVRTDHVVERYTKEADQNAPDENDLEHSKRQYQQTLLKELFDFTIVENNIAQLFRIFLEHETSFQGDVVEKLRSLETKAEACVFSFAKKFQSQLPYYFQQKEIPEENEILQERVRNASSYFSAQIKKELLPAVQKLPLLTDNQTFKKSAKEKLNDFKKSLFTKNVCFEASMNGFSINQYILAKANADLDFEKTEKSTPKTKSPVIKVPHPKLNTQLIQWRKDKSKELDVLLYRVLSTKSLLEILHSLPIDLKNLKRVKGIGPKKVQQFGEEILEMVEAYCEENQIGDEFRDQFEEEEKKTPVQKKLSSSKEISFNLFKAGKSIDEIAKERGFTRGTIESHLFYYIGTGDLDIFSLIEKKKVKHLEAFFENTQTDSLSEAKAKLGEAYSYAEIRMVRAYLKGTEKI
jgi:GTPase SAR1 family protein